MKADPCIAAEGSGVSRLILRLNTLITSKNVLRIQHSLIQQSPLRRLLDKGVLRRCQDILHIVSVCFI